jgi:polar amino acid transport system substrate-binding protein
VDAYAATELTVSKLVEGSQGVEQVKPFADPIVDGKPVRNYGGFAFRSEDKELHGAFNKELVEFRKTEDYQKILMSYGLSAESIKAAAAKNVADLCAGQ